MMDRDAFSSCCDAQLCFTHAELSLSEARALLDEHHHGLDKVQKCSYASCRNYVC